MDFDYLVIMAEIVDMHKVGRVLTVRGVRDGYETVREFVETKGMFISRHII